jgi:hypothetical protein
VVAMARKLLTRRLQHLPMRGPMIPPGTLPPRKRLPPPRLKQQLAEGQDPAARRNLRRLLLRRLSLWKVTHAPT